MKTIVSKTNIYEYYELNDYGRRQAIENFVNSKIYQYSYAWSDEKRIRTIINDKMYFTYTGDIVPT